MSSSLVDQRQLPSQPLTLGWGVCEHSPAPKEQGWRSLCQQNTWAVKLAGLFWGIAGQAGQDSGSVLSRDGTQDSKLFLQLTWLYIFKSRFKYHYLTQMRFKLGKRFRKEASLLTAKLEFWIFKKVFTESFFKWFPQTIQRYHFKWMHQETSSSKTRTIYTNVYIYIYTHIHISNIY